MKKPVFTGAAVAIITPMNADGSVNFEELGRIIDDQIAHGTDAIVICGTTGESPTLSDEEHTACIRYAVKQAAGRVPVIAGTGSNDTKYAIWLSQQAQADGADALLLVTPYYNKTSQAGLVAHYTAIANAVNLPCILYNVPSRTGCNLTPASLAQLAKLPNINAVKEASGNISQVAEIAAACGTELNIYSGNDDQVVPLLSLGGKGGNGEGHGEPVVLMGGDGRAVERTAAVDDHAVVGWCYINAHGKKSFCSCFDTVSLFDLQFGSIPDDRSSLGESSHHCNHRNLINKRRDNFSANSCTMKRTGADKKVSSRFSIHINI